MDFKNDKKIDSDQSIIQDNNTGLNIVPKNNYLNFVLKKTEKLVSAIYLMTNFFDADEPLRHYLRESGLRLLSLNVSLNHAELGQRQNIAKEIISVLVEIVSLFEIGHISGLVSEMNFSILKKEFQDLIEALNSKDIYKDSENNLILSPSFFELPFESQSDPQSNMSLTSAALGSSIFEREKADNNLKDKNISLSQHLRPGAFSNIAQEKIDLNNQKKDNKTIVIVGNDKSLKRTERKETVLSIFKKNKNQAFTIKDISLSIKGCSEKTIQRQLLDLVSEGVLKKEGERRWSKYSLK